jgi:hypothetical protein
VRAIVRNAALRLPPIRRLYDYAMQQARESQECAATLAALTTSASAREQQLEAEIRAATEGRVALVQQLEAEIRAATEERDALELQLYVLRSDHQRAAVRNHELSAALRGAEARAEQAPTAGTGVTSQELSLLYAKIAARLTLLSSEIARLRPSPTDNGDGITLYLDLLERALTGILGEDAAMDPWTKGYDPEIRLIGRDWPSAAQTMIGLARMRNLRVLAERVVMEGIPGDMLEAGVWRGGACILLRGILAAHGITDRTVWVADSFAGLPAADAVNFPADADDQHATYDSLRVSSDEVQANFQRYGLLDRQVRFLKGWFAETLPEAPIARLAILRLDGDMYASTIQTLDALYDKVSPGGYIIVDDYILAGCRQAVDDFRGRRAIQGDLNDVDGAAVFWRKA